MVEFRRKKGESFENFLRRVNRAIQRSGKLLEARKRKFRRYETSRNLKKKSALKRIELNKEREYLKKIGKLESKNLK